MRLRIGQLRKALEPPETDVAMTTPHPRAFVVGHPIAHSRSPLIHGHWLAEHGLPGTYERVDVHPDAFPEFVRSLHAAGFVGGSASPRN
jgi:shikimate dehydrogenase